MTDLESEAIGAVEMAVERANVAMQDLNERIRQGAHPSRVLAAAQDLENYATAMVDVVKDLIKIQGTVTRG